MKVDIMQMVILSETSANLVGSVMAREMNLDKHQHGMIQ